MPGVWQPGFHPGHPIRFPAWVILGVVQKKKKPPQERTILLLGTQCLRMQCWGHEGQAGGRYLWKEDAELMQNNGRSHRCKHTWFSLAAANPPKWLLASSSETFQSHPHCLMVPVNPHPVLVLLCENVILRASLPPEFWWCCPSKVTGACPAHPVRAGTV